jgi:hypothetical protein
MRFDKCCSPSDYLLLEPYGVKIEVYCPTFVNQSWMQCTQCTNRLHSTFCKRLAPILCQKLGELVLTAAVH